MTARFASVIEAVKAGEGYVAIIAEQTGKHPETVRRILVGYERRGVVRRCRGARRAHLWVIA